jgi:hypothetical protein
VQELSSQEICRRFNDLPWHDSELRGVRVNYSGSANGHENRYEVILNVNLRSSSIADAEERFTPVEIKFSQTRIFQADLDLLGVAYCGGDISGAKCEEKSDFMRRTDETRIANFDLPQDSEPLADLKHFRISLCPPSGQIDIIAKDFETIEPDH